MHLVTVIVPVYNVERYLSKCINSIINQSYKNLQIILIDDGSKDNSFSICKSFEKKDQRIEVHHTENQGLSHARNVGLNYAVGEYILFVDSDDYVHPNMITTMMRKADGADLIICNYERVPENDEVEIVQDKKCLKNELWTCEHFWHCYYFENLSVFCCVAWNKLYKKRLFNDLRYPLNKTHEDEFIIGDIINQCNKVKVITDTLYYYVQRPDSIMHGTYQGNFDDAEALVSRCVVLQKSGMDKALERNLNVIPGLLILGLNEIANGNKERIRYRYLREEYNRSLQQYLRKQFSVKLYFKAWMLKMPKLYNLFLRTKYNIIDRCNNELEQRSS